MTLKIKNFSKCLQSSSKKHDQTCIALKNKTKQTKTHLLWPRSTFSQKTVLTHSCPTKRQKQPVMTLERSKVTGKFYISLKIKIYVICSPCYQADHVLLILSVALNYWLVVFSPNQRGN